MKCPIPLSPMTPPVAAQARIWSSRMFRPRCVSAHGLEWLKITGAAETLHRLERGPVAAVGRVHDHAHPVHLGHHVPPERRSAPTSAPWQPPPAELSRL